MVAVWKQLVQTEKDSCSPLLGRFICHHGPRSIPLCIQRHIQLTSLSFQVSRPSHSWDTAISIFYHENPRSRSWLRGEWFSLTAFLRTADIEVHIVHTSRSWLRSKFEVTMLVQHPIDSHPFCSMSTGPSIPEIQHFQNLTLKIQGQCHNWRPHSRYNTLSTRITFVRCRWALTFLSIAIEKFDLENPRSRSWLRWTLKVTPWVQHSIDSHPFRSMSICHPIPEIQLFFKFDLENPRSRSWLRSKLKVTKWV